MNTLVEMGVKACALVWNWKALGICIPPLRHYSATILNGCLEVFHAGVNE